MNSRNHLSVTGYFWQYTSILKMENINLKSHPVFPLNHEENGGTHRIEGIGDSFVPKILKLNALHSEIRVDDEDAIVVAQIPDNASGVHVPRREG